MLTIVNEDLSVAQFERFPNKIFQYKHKYTISTKSTFLLYNRHLRDIFNKSLVFMLFIYCLFLRASWKRVSFNKLIRKCWQEKFKQETVFHFTQTILSKNDNF